MKNKKLFAILTLVCFMMTLVPFAAFAATGDPVTSAAIVLQADGKIKFAGASATASDKIYVNEFSTTTSKIIGAAVASIASTTGGGTVDETAAIVAPASVTTYIIYNESSDAGDGASAPSNFVKLVFSADLTAASKAAVAWDTYKTAVNTANASLFADEYLPLTSAQKALFDTAVGAGDTAYAAAIAKDAHASNAITLYDAFVAAANVANRDAFNLAYAKTTDVAVSALDNTKAAAIKALSSVAVVDQINYQVAVNTKTAYDAYLADNTVTATNAVAKGTAFNALYSALTIPQKAQFDALVGSNAAATIVKLSAAIVASDNTVAYSYYDTLKNGSSGGGNVPSANRTNLVATNAADAQTSYVATSDRNATANTNSSVEIYFDIKTKAPAAAGAEEVYIWAIEDGQSVPTTALDAVASQTSGTDVDPAYAGMAGVKKLTDVITGDEYSLKFSRSGSYKIYASFVDPATISGSSTTDAYKIANVTKLQVPSKEEQSITITGTAASSSKYTTSVTAANQNLTYKDPAASITSDVAYKGQDVKTGATISGLKVAADNVATQEVSLKIKDDTGNAVKGATVKITTNSANLTVDSESITTNALGNASFKVSGSHEGTYRVYVTCGSYDLTINVTVGSTSAAYIKVTKEPTGPIDVDNTDLAKIVRFTMTDINGNLVKPAQAKVKEGGAYKAFNSTMSNLEGKDATGYVSIVSQPSASTLKNSDVSLKADQRDKNENTATLDFNGKPLKAEGTYEFKIVLDNGNYATVKLEVKEFTTPVELVLTYAAPGVALGGTAYVNDLLYKDANGVTKDATPYVNVAGTGYAIQNLDTVSQAKGAVTVKADEKYVGTTITVTAVDERYNLSASATLTVADEATALSFSGKTATVNVNNAITVSLVDGNGNRVALGDKGSSNVDDISYVITEKPEGAKVSATTAAIDNNLLNSGTFKMNLVSNKIGNVTVQVVAKITNRDTTNNNNQAVTKYYTGTQTFAVGTGETGKVVVMSIGSNEIITNDKTATIDAKPVVQNNRTFVPFRALAEAFGAEVAYDEATQAVTAKLNGVTVVLTVGSPTYTVNGVEKTADVAPFISGSRTMVPVRFVAEAFGIKVTPTYDENGATADILFNL